MDLLVSNIILYFCGPCFKVGDLITAPTGETAIVGSAKFKWANHSWMYQLAGSEVYYSEEILALVESNKEQFQVAAVTLPPSRKAPKINTESNVIDIRSRRKIKVVRP